MKIPQEERPGELNMTPMIDVVFQLLIFFMLSMHFTRIEGKLITTLPKDKGQSSLPPQQQDLQQIHVYLCAGGDIRTHTLNKGEHEKTDKDASVCSTRVGQTDCGDLHMTEKDATKAAHNRGIYAAIAEKARELHEMTPSARDPNRRTPIVIDADSETPYEHIVGVVNALKKRELQAIEFSGNPRFQKYAGKPK